MANVVHDRIAVTDVPYAPFRTMLLAWNDSRPPGGGVPSRDTINPFLEPTLSGSTVLFEVTEDLGFIYRLTGETLRRLVRTNSTGRPVADVVGTGAYGRLIAGQLRDAVTEGLPVFAHHNFQLADEAFQRQSQRIAMPYEEGGRVTRLLCYQIISDDVQLRDASLPETETWEIVTLAFVARFEGGDVAD